MLLTLNSRPGYVQTERGSRYSLFPKNNPKELGLLPEDSLVDLPKSFDELTLLLNKYSVNTTDWGSNSAKSIDDLYREVQLGIVRFSTNLDGLLRRNINIVRIKVEANIFKKKHRLIEVGQVFLPKLGGSCLLDIKSFTDLKPDHCFFDDMRRRKRNLDTVNRKVPVGVCIPKIARQALISELKLDAAYVDNSLYFTPGLTVTFDQPNLYNHSFPGLGTVYTFYYYSVQLDDHCLNPNGYVDWGDRLVTFFDWIPV